MVRHASDIVAAPSAAITDAPPSGKERPILFSAPMVRALLAGTKTQTRRAVKAEPPANADGAGVIWSPNPKSNGLWFWLQDPEFEGGVPVGDDFRCPYGVPGDVLWVRESLTVRNDGSRAVPKLVPMYAADWEGFDKPDRDWDWTPSSHMPRWASRITLKITDVRVERLNDISEADALAEGIIEKPDRIWWVDDGNPKHGYGSPRAAYAELWSSINGPGSWDANPWVWALTFERVGQALAPPTDPQP